MEHIPWLRAMYDELAGCGLVTEAVDWSSPEYEEGVPMAHSVRNDARLMSVADLFPDVRVAPTRLAIAEHYCAHVKAGLDQAARGGQADDGYLVYVSGQRSPIKIDLDKITRIFMPAEPSGLAVNKVAIGIEDYLELAIHFGEDFAVVDPAYRYNPSGESIGFDPLHALLDFPGVRQRIRKRFVLDMTGLGRTPAEANFFGAYDISPEALIPRIAGFVGMLSGRES